MKLARSVSGEEKLEMMMPVILKPGNNRLAFLLGRASALRVTGETVEQLTDQLHAERSQHALDVARLQQQNAILAKELTEALQRNVLAALRELPCTGQTVH